MPSLFFNGLAKSAELIDCLQVYIVSIVKWLTLLMTLTVCFVIISRWFDIGSTAIQESIGYMHATLFMLCMAYTAYADGHVRVDIFYRRYSPLSKAWLNLLGGCFFLLPFSLFLLFITWQSAAQSWAIQESSNNPGGLALVFLLKSLAPATGVLLSLHALSDVFKQLITISVRPSSLTEGANT